MQNAALFDSVRASDEAVAKALALSEVARIAKAEQRLRQYLLAEWQRLAREATRRAGELVEQGANAKRINRAVKGILEPWADVVSPRVAKEVDRIYRLAKVAGWKKATGQTKAPLTYDTPNFTELEKAAPREGFAIMPAFDVVDEGAIAALSEQQNFWLAAHYEENIGASIASTVSEVMVEGGESRRATALVMRERLAEQLGQVITPLGWHGSVRQYMEGVAANAATVSRAYGQVAAFNEAEFKEYEIVNPLDERTCPVCSHMDGKVFQVEQANKQIAAELEANDRDDIKRIHPWYQPKELKEISPKPGHVSAADSASLAKAGIPLPPFHFRCRCAVDAH